MPITRRSPLPSSATPAIMPAWVEPVTVQTIDVVEEHAELGLLRGDLAHPVREAQAAERMVGGAGGDRIGLAAGRLDRLQRLPPAVADADVEARPVHPDVAAHDPA